MFALAWCLVLLLIKVPLFKVEVRQACLVTSPLLCYSGRDFLMSFGRTTASPCIMHMTSFVLNVKAVFATTFMQGGILKYLCSRAGSYFNTVYLCFQSWTSIRKDSQTKLAWMFTLTWQCFAVDLAFPWKVSHSSTHLFLCVVIFFLYWN